MTLRPTALVAILLCAFLLSCTRSHPSLPYHASFSDNTPREWMSFGGNWSFSGGTARNNSDERGAKLVGGNADWSDYVVEVDLQILGEVGDAGIILRVSDEESGIDSYRGYYIGLRSTNDLLTIGRADHRWMELAVQRLPTGVRVGSWYHLIVAVLDCKVVAVVNEIGSSKLTRVAVEDIGCPTHGKIGLRSYAAGGIWRNLNVSPIATSSFEELRQGVPLPRANHSLQTERGFNSMILRDKRIENTLSEATLTDQIPLTELGSLSENFLARQNAPVRVIGSVTLLAPSIFIQDSTGGALLRDLPPRPLRIGDEVEILGRPYFQDRRVEFLAPSLRVIRAQEPIPPILITPYQAALGAFSNRYVELEGRVIREASRDGNQTVIELESPGQRFLAILPESHISPVLEGIHKDSQARLSGVVTRDVNSDKAFFPFVVILRSDQDILITAPPPWWSPAHVVVVVLGCSILIGVGFWVYFRIGRWRFEAVTDERSRLAREIHDTLAQSFAAIAFQLESTLTPGPQMAATTLALQMAKQSRKEAHATIATLRSMQTESTIAAMIEKAAVPICAATSKELRLNIPGQVHLPPEAIHHVIRIVQEAVSNAVRHSSCQTINIALIQAEDRATLTIQDDGRGFVRNAQSEHEHFGLLGMEERARALSGSMTVRPARPFGTQVVVSFPTPRHTSMMQRIVTQWRLKRGRVNE